MDERFLWTNTDLERAEPSLPLLLALEVTEQVSQVFVWLTVIVRVMVQVELLPPHTSLPSMAASSVSVSGVRVLRSVGGRLLKAWNVTGSLLLPA
jgi:hypothetical protein